MAIANVALYTA